jgi:hypothetical protein
VDKMLLQKLYMRQEPWHGWLLEVSAW